MQIQAYNQVHQFATAFGPPDLFLRRLLLCTALVALMR